MSQIEQRGDRLEVGARKRGSWRPILLVGAAVAVGLLGGRLATRSRSEAPPPSLTLSPAVIDMTGRRMTDPDPLRVEFTLRNDSAAAITVTGIAPSCACTTVMPEGRSEPPFILEPAAATSFDLTTNLASRFGPQSFTVMIASSADGRELAPLGGRVDVVVDSPLAPFPQALDVGRLEPGSESKRRIVLGDTLDSGAVQIVAITPSDPSAIEVVPGPTDEVVEKGKGYTVRGRYALDVTIKADDREPARRESIAVGLSDGRELHVPVVWSVALPYELSPREISVVGAEPGRRVERSVFVRLGADRDPGEPPRVVAVPEGLEVRVEPFGSNQWRVRVEMVIPERGVAASNEVALEAGREGVPIVIPVVVACD